MSHHLMVYILMPNGEKIEKAKVGYLIQGPKKEKQKVMTMAMREGFGADVRMKDKGTYLIKTKVVLNGKKIIDQFNYHIQ